MEYYPFLFEPVYKDYIWGGDKLATRFDRSVPGAVTAESWEISDRPEGMSIIQNGPLKGKTLGELVQIYGTGLIGKNQNFETFPLLIKIIDAKQKLSVQVHPDDISAKKTDGEPKTEAWLVLDAEPGSVVYAGFNRPTKEIEFRKALEAGEVEKLLKPIPVWRGDIIYIPGGRVHCIGAGCLLLEVQQNSNTTYRVYDWGRVGNDGKPRELHVEQAMRVIHWDDTGPDNIRPADAPDKSNGNCFMELLRTTYFCIERARLSGNLECPMDGLWFHVVFVESGRVRIEAENGSVEAGPGTSALMPAGMGDYRLIGTDAELVRIGL